MIVTYSIQQVEILEGDAIRPKYFRFVDDPDVIYMTEIRKPVDGVYTCAKCELGKDSKFCTNAPRCGPDSQVNDMTHKNVLGRTPNTYCHFKKADYSITKYDAPTVEILHNV